MEKLQLKIGGMACSFCTETLKKGVGRMEGVASIQEALGRLTGALSVEGDPRTKKVTITTRDGPARFQAIEAALVGLGHVVEEK